MVWTSLDTNGLFSREKQQKQARKGQNNNQGSNNYQKSHQKPNGGQEFNQNDFFRQYYEQFNRNRNVSINQHHYAPLFSKF